MTYRSNLDHASALLAKAAQENVKLAVLPENFAMFAAGAQLATAKQLPKIQAWLSEQALINCGLSQAACRV
jgi:predicted amidohydrolase